MSMSDFIGFLTKSNVLITSSPEDIIAVSQILNILQIILHLVYFKPMKSVVVCVCVCARYKDIIPCLIIIMREFLQ